MKLPAHFTAADGLLDGARCVFVVGAPRSGTTWLQRMIEAHPNVASIPQELTIFSRYLAPIARAYDLEEANITTGRWRQGLPLLWPKDRFERHVREALTAAYAEVIARKPEATVLLDKHPGYCHHLPLIERYLPGSRIIHIIRDGREVAVSMLSAKERIGFGASTIQGCAQEWAGSVAVVMAHGASAGPQRYLELRYEELTVRTTNELLRVMAFCQLPMSAAEAEVVAAAHHISRNAVSRGDPALQRLREQKGDSWSTRIDLKQRYWFDRIAGRLLCELGYAAPGWWSAGTLDRLRMAFFPARVKAGETLRQLARIWGSPIVRPSGRHADGAR